MSIFPTKILLATDGSQDAELAATTAVALAKATGSELHVATVFPGPEYVHPHYETHYPEAAEQLRREARKERQEVLNERVERIREAGGSVAQMHIREGEADAEIVTLAQELGAGLIALGSRGLGGIRRVLMGDISDSVVRHAHCPVMVVRGEPVVFPTKILVATDSSREAELAARTAADLAQKTNSELHVAYAFGIAPVGPPVYPEATDLQSEEFEAENEERQQSSERRAREVLDAEVEKIRSDGGAVAGEHIVEGRVAAEIVRLAEEIGAGLIVLGSRGLGGIRRALMGSVSDSVVRHAHCPVMVVREE